MIVLRDGVIGDVNFILNSAVQSIRDNVAWCDTVPAPRYFASVHDTLKALLQRCPVTVAAREADPDAILGYLIAHPKRPAVMWMYVKQPMRRFGVARLLLVHWHNAHRDASSVETPFRTEDGRRTVQTVLRLPLVENPFLLSEAV